MAEAQPNFVHLHVHTQYSLLDGACQLDELLDLTRKYGIKACAMTDHGNMFGAIEFYEKAAAKGIKPIIGCEIYVAPESRFDKTTHGIKGASYHLILLAKNMTGYRNLMEIVSIGYLEGFYYKPRVDKEVLARCHEGLIALSACLKGEIAHFLLIDQYDQAKRACCQYRDIFGKDNFYLEVQDNKIAEQNKLNNLIVKLAHELALPLAATNDVHYLNRDDAMAHDALLCIQTQNVLSDANRLKFQTDQMYFKSPQEMEKAFKHIPEVITNTVKISEECNVKLEFNELHLPEFKAPSGEDNLAFLNHLVDEGLKKQYGTITDELKTRASHELRIIQESGYVSYFLIVWDFIKHAKEKGIPVGPGRGSAAGSIVSFALGITEVDPMKYDLIFERFLNPDRVTMPDIDIDFCFERRNEVIDYVVEKYSKDNVAQIITFGTMMAKGVIRDVGRVMGMPYIDVDRIAKLIPNDLGITIEEALAIEPELKTKYEGDPVVRQLVDTSKRLEGLTRHASTHAAGVVISDKPLYRRMPLFKTQDDQITTGYSMKSLERIGMLKMDFLGLKTLTVIDQTIKITKRTKNIDISIEKIPFDDKAAFELLAKAETSGVFQLESSGMRDLLRKLKPEKFEELIAILALYRPGPMGSGMIEEFIKRKQGEIEVKYDHPSLELILKETYGIIVFQEQVMRIVSNLAGFSMAEADIVRKVMGKKIKDEKALEAIRNKFLEGTSKNNINRAIAEKIWDFIAYFAGYGFNKSHSTGYAIISYRTAYLKANYPIEFMTALLASEKNNTDKISDYIGESLQMGIEILPPDVNESFRDFTVVEGGIRFGLSAVKNVGIGASDSIINARSVSGRFESLYDFAEKVDTRLVNKKVIESLIKCGAFDSFGIRRSQAVAILDKVLEMASKASKDRSLGQIMFFDDEHLAGTFKNGFQDVPNIPEWAEHELLQYEKEMLGFYITKHPLTRFEKLLNTYSTCKISNLATLADGDEVLIGGIINKVKITVTRKKAEKMAILTLEDLDNFIEVIVFPKVYRKVFELIKEDSLVYVQGRLNLREEEPRIMAEGIVPIEKARESFTKSVLIKMSMAGLGEDAMKQVKEIVMRFKGRTPVYIDFVSTEGRRIRISPGDELSVIPTDELVGNLEQVVGEGNVKFLTK